MTDGQIMSLVLLVGWLILAGSAVASFRLGWAKLARLALVWIAIFGGLSLAAHLLGLSLPNT